MAQNAVEESTGPFPGDRMRLSLDRSGIIDVEWASPGQHLSWDVGLMVNYASRPVTLRRVQTGEVVGSLLDSRLTGNLFGTLSLFGILSVGLDVPIILTQGRPGELTVDSATQTLAALTPTGLGDLRVLPKLRILNQDEHGIHLGILAGVTFPTGGGRNFFGDRSVSFQPELAVSRSIGRFRIATNLGAHLREVSTYGDQRLGQELTGRLGLGYRFWDADDRSIPLEIDASAFGAISVSGNSLLENLQRGLEGRVQASYILIDRLQLFVGGGLGLLAGWGVPDWRVYGGLRFGGWDEGAKPAPKPKVDTDKDGLLDEADKCPTEPETVNGYQDEDGCPDEDDDPDKDGIKGAADKCPRIRGIAANSGCPDTDKDSDGIPDRLDKCPINPEDKDGFEDEDGCPDPDNDGDGVPDKADRCPDTKGVVDNAGCPDKDTDGDTVVDRLDNCPTEKGEARFQGCKAKQKVVITKDRLDILEQVNFATGSDKIVASSFPLLDNVARVLNAHPEVEKVRVEGHTDNQGKPEANLSLSDRRAKAVVKYLVEKGKVDAGRLEGQGYGDTRPIADNKTAAGRTQNRRVVFVLGGQGSPEVETR